MVARTTAEHCRAAGDEVAALSRAEMDIADIEGVRRAFERHRPEVVINCAAYTNVDGAESEPERAVAANSRGVVNLAMAAREHDTGFVTISTDYVFDGAYDGFYTQRHQPNPLGVYAKTKRDGEIAAMEAYARTIVVRTGWIYGRGGTNFLCVMDKLMAEGKIVKAIGNSFGTPTFADDLAVRLRELAVLDMPAIFHVTNSGPGTSYLGFAGKIAEIGGFDASLIEPVSNDDLKRPAPRPASSKIACLFSEKFGLKPMPDWEDGMRRFLASRS